jgi:hypothetical protein
LTTTALVLANFDPADALLELVVGTSLDGLKFHQFAGGVFQAAISMIVPPVMLSIRRHWQLLTLMGMGILTLRW